MSSKIYPQQKRKALGSLFNKWLKADCQAETCKDCPKQSDASSCGVFSLANAERIARDVGCGNFSQKHIYSMRLQICEQLQSRKAQLLEAKEIQEKEFKKRAAELLATFSIRSSSSSSSSSSVSSPPSSRRPSSIKHCARSASSAASQLAATEPGSTAALAAAAAAAAAAAPLTTASQTSTDGSVNRASRSKETLSSNEMPSSSSMSTLQKIPESKESRSSTSESGGPSSPGEHHQTVKELTDKDIPWRISCLDPDKKGDFLEELNLSDPKSVVTDDLNNKGQSAAQPREWANCPGQGVVENAYSQIIDYRMGPRITFLVAFKKCHPDGSPIKRYIDFTILIKLEPREKLIDFLRALVVHHPIRWRYFKAKFETSDYKDTFGPDTAFQKEILSDEVVHAAKTRSRVLNRERKMRFLAKKEGSARK